LHVCELTLLITDLFRPVQQNTQPVTHKNFIAPALKKIITRSHRCKVTAKSYNRLLFELFNIKMSDQDDVPLAAVMRLVDKPLRSDEYYMFADPVHLRADRDSIIMLGNKILDIKAHETDRIINIINSHFQAEVFRLEVIAGHRWCLSVPTVQKIHTYPLVEVIGQNIHQYLPYGEDSRHWRNILNEVQMLLSNSQVNQEREARGELAINSLWFWGGGTLPASVKSPWAKVCSNEYLVQGLACHVGVSFEVMPKDASSWYNDAGTGKHLVTMGDVFNLKQTDDFDEWHNIMMDMDTQWFVPLLALLKSKQLSSLTVYLDATNCYHISPLLARRWWQGIINRNSL